MRMLGAALVLGGGILVSVGVAGTVLDGGPGAAPASPAPRPAPASPGETVEGFLDLLGEAMGAGDAAFLVDRLHPIVVEVYGRASCLAAMEELEPVRFRVRSVGELATYAWVADGVRREVPETLTVRVRARTETGAVIRDVHLPRAGGSLRWLTDCGDPLA